MIRQSSQLKSVNLFVVSVCAILAVACFWPKAVVFQDFYLSMPWVGSQEICNCFFSTKFDYSTAERARKLVWQLNDSGQEKKAVKTLVGLVNWESNALGYDSETVRESFLLFGSLDKSGKISSSEWSLLCQPVEERLVKLVEHKFVGLELPVKSKKNTIAPTWHVQQQFASGYANHRVWEKNIHWLISASINAKEIEGVQSLAYLNSQYLLAKSYVRANDKASALSTISYIESIKKTAPTTCSSEEFGNNLLDRNIVMLKETMH